MVLPDVARHLLCSICNDYMREPYCRTCCLSANFCRLCIDRWEASNADCPVCRKPGKAVPHPPVTRELILEQPNECLGCGERMTVRQLIDHLRTCALAPVRCSCSLSLGCTVDLPAADMPAHEAQHVGALNEALHVERLALAGSVARECSLLQKLEAANAKVVQLLQARTQELAELTAAPDLRTSVQLLEQLVGDLIANPPQAAPTPCWERQKGTLFAICNDLVKRTRQKKHQLAPSEEPPARRRRLATPVQATIVPK